MEKPELNSGCNNNGNTTTANNSSNSCNNTTNNSNSNTDATEPDSAQLYMEYLQYKVVQNPELREKLLRRLLTKCIKVFLSYRDEEVRKYLM